jgi:hypothetical protein
MADARAAGAGRIAVTRHKNISVIKQPASRQPHKVAHAQAGLLRPRLKLGVPPAGIRISNRVSFMPDKLGAMPELQHSATVATT